MRKKIQDLAYARFQHEKPSLQAPGEELAVTALLGEENRGIFLLSSGNGIPLKGVVLSSHPRMRVPKPEFEGTKVTVSYEFDCRGLLEGSEEKGVFTVIYNGGEYSLPFRVSITRFYAASRVGIIRSLGDFVRLAQASYEEAYRIFTAPFFENVLLKATKTERRLYRESGGTNSSMQGMEEFLIRLGKKKRVVFRTKEQERRLSEFSEDIIKETVTVKKDGWGYLALTVSSDTDWLVPEKKKLTTGEFVGNTLTVDVLIKRAGLHGGNNYARLHFDDGEESRFIEFCVRGRAPRELKKRLEQKRLLVKLTRLYLDFRMKKIVTGVWSKESSACLKRLREMEPDNLWYVLYHAQALLVNKQWQESEWILDEFRRQTVGTDTPLYAYYLYLCTLMEKEPSYVSKTFGKIREIAKRHREDIRLCFVTLFLDPKLQQSKSRKLAAIREKVNEGMNSPLLYMEAYYLISHDAGMLGLFYDFERKVLYWAAREGVLTPQVAEQVNKGMSRVRAFHPMWYRILKASYQAKPKRELLSTLCGCCIKWNLLGAEQFPWYDRAVREELTIAGLFEAWLESAPLKQPIDFPRPVLIYFKYQHTVSAQRRALMYGNIIENKETYPGVYEEYRFVMEQFAGEQKQAGRREEYLKPLYREFLPGEEQEREAAGEPDLPDEELAEEAAGQKASLARRISLADREILAGNGEADERLIAESAAIFRSGTYTERILWYLCRHFQGSIKELEALWQAARQFGLNAYEMEERFLVQLMYTEGRTEAMEDIFESYFAGHGQEMVLMAALSYFSYRYFVSEQPVADGIFTCMLKQLALGNPLNDCCRLACLKWLTLKTTLSESQSRQREELLEHYVLRGMYFSFYHKLPADLKEKHLLFDKVILEYRTNPKHRVSIRYLWEKPGEESVSEEMEPAFEGIFVKSFTLCCDERISYSIWEEERGSVELIHTESGTLGGNGLSEEAENGANGTSRYAMLNRMLKEFKARDMEALKEVYQRYRRLEQETESFRLL